MDLEALFRGRGVDLPRWAEHLRGIAESLGLPFGDRRRTYNTRLAQELGIWAEAQGRGDAYRWAAFRTYFAAGRNIGDPAVLAEIAAEAGLDGAEASAVLEARRFREHVDRAWARARQLGVSAVPTFLAEGRLLVGYRDRDALGDFLSAANSPGPRGGGR